jgi:Domain of unknown function (DUF4214)
MRIRTAVMTGLTGLMLTVGLGDAFAQPVVVYREAPMARRYARGDWWQAQQVVRQAYLDVLRREPDAGGLRQYTNAMLREGWSASDVRRSLMTSDEYAQRFGNTRYGRGYRSNRYRNGYRNY